MLKLQSSLPDDNIFIQKKTNISEHCKCQRAFGREGGGGVVGRGNGNLNFPHFIANH